MSKLQKIRKEVERLRNLHQMKYQQLDTNDNMCLVECGKRNLCDELLSFIDSLQEEPISEELEEAAEGYAVTVTDEVLPNGKVMINFQVEKAFRVGAKWRMAQIIKNATSVTVHIDAGGYPYIPQLELYDYDKDVPLAKEGDRYKVVLIKEG